MGKQKKYRVVGLNGIGCIRCGRPTEIREHTHITDKHLRQPYYFSMWFNCLHKDCPTTIFMVDEYKVWNKNGAANQLRDYEEQQERLDFINKL